MEQTPTARQPGTTITITHLFAPLPVRRAEFQRTVSRHSARLLKVLQGYALVAVGCRLACSNVKGAKGSRWGCGWIDRPSARRPLSLSLTP